MTLAIILFAFLGTATAPPPGLETRVHQSAEPTTAADKPATTAAQDSPAASKSTSSNTPQSASSQSPPASAKPRRRKQRAAASNCVPASTVNSGSGSGSGSASASATTPGAPPQDPATAGASSTSGSASTPKVCPPPKTIVRQGGTSDPTIQLAGGAGGDQAAHQEDTAHEMLGATRANLKKLEGRQLTPGQQDIVKQVHQFMEQSNSAVTAGDPERARTLAWKAQLLSEELTKPEK